MNAIVTLPIGDLDKLRNDLKESQEKVKFYEKNEKVVKLVVKDHSFGHEYNINYGYRFIDKYVEREPEYINFEDVKAELKKEAESNVIKELGDLKREILNLQSKLQEKETGYQKSLIQQKEEHKKAIEKLEEDSFKNIERIQDEHEEQKTKLEKEIAILKGEDVDTELEKLKKEILQLKTRGFFERLFNI